MVKLMNEESVLQPLQDRVYLKCDQCAGTGVIPELDNSLSACQKCQSRGYIPTDTIEAARLKKVVQDLEAHARQADERAKLLACNGSCVRLARGMAIAYRQAIACLHKAGVQ